ncbi:Por secretion system C-terminal sorting domain-containing protein [Lishizhenia tianjinensis]|uniref:Por secretion system C-terminal sorting domain-containing protein n=1 Tax=Lishizhenia tianjinensis TaxID=477690 RepID=A0A1I6Y2S8_9FLAO|nr:T9SS type A sorting domain-containing protein [Lishizhenia tianjinensis]SFT44925.1 Por secretion system C-terminal sorting domain-containing protein [Lishizhenia tianjinensis]
MKKLVLSLSVFASLYGMAQSSETVTLGSGYAQQAWYSLETGNTTLADLSEYHLAFQSSAMGTAIRFNSAIATLYKVSEDTTQFSTLNLTDNSTWESFVDSDTSWSQGAFNLDNDGMFDIGWGDYDMTTHHVNGDQVYVIELGNGDLYKVLISNLISGVYTVRIATADNSIDTYVTIDKSNYATKSLVYLDVVNQNVLDREPAADAWDFLFTKYTDNTINYGVTGVLQNGEVEIAQYDGVTPATHTQDGSVAYNTEINTIGYDWKSFNGTGYVVVDDRVYYVKDVMGNYWKVIFTGTSGSSTGEFSFTKEKIGSAHTEKMDLALFKVYPNPVQEALNIVLDTEQAGVVNIVNAQGLLVLSNTVNAGFTQKSLDVSQLESGAYFVQIQLDNGRVYTQQIIK